MTVAMADLVMSSQSPSEDDPTPEASPPREEGDSDRALRGAHNAAYSSRHPGRKQQLRGEAQREDESVAHILAGVAGARQNGMHDEEVPPQKFSPPIIRVNTSDPRPCRCVAGLRREAASSRSG